MGEPYDTISELLLAYERRNQVRVNELIEPLIARFPSHLEVLQVASLVAAARGDVNQSLVFQRRAIALNICREGDILHSVGRKRDAKDLYLEALNIDSLNPEAADSLSAYYRQPAEYDARISRLGKPQPEIYHTPIGKYYVPADARHDIIVRRMKSGLIFDSDILSMLTPYISVGSTVVDLGANLGQMTLAFSDLVGDEGQVISVEAEEFIFSLLQKNIHASGKKNILAIEAAAFDRPDDMLIYPDPDLSKNATYGSHGLDLRKTEGRKVKTITIDSLSIDKPVSAIKVDIQGSDIFAMRGAVSTIQKFKPAIAFEIEEEFLEGFGTSRKDYFDFIESIGYKIEVDMWRNFLIVPR